MAQDVVGVYEQQQEYENLSLFPDDREIPVDVVDSLQVKLSQSEAAGGAIKRDVRSSGRLARSAIPPDVLVCRLQDGKVTYIHRRLWPTVVRLADWLDGTKLAAIREEHKPSGAHKLHLIPFPKWVPTEIRQVAKELSEQEAISQLADWIDVIRPQKSPASGRSRT